MFNLIRKDYLLIFSSKATIFMFLFFLPFFQFTLGSDNYISIPLVSIITFGYMLTTMSFNFEMKNKPYVMVRSLPIKTRDIVMAKYIHMFLNYIIAVLYTFIYMKILNLLGLTISDDLDMGTLKEGLFLVILALSISLPLQFRLPAKIANFVNIFFFMFLINYFSLTLGRDLVSDFSNLIVSVTLIVIFFISMGLSALLYKSRDLS